MWNLGIAGVSGWNFVENMENVKFPTAVPEIDGRMEKITSLKGDKCDFWGGFSPKM